MLIAEDLLLLLTEDATGSCLLPPPTSNLGLGGANLIELTLITREKAESPAASSSAIPLRPVMSP
jgi:hypothetical protein